MEKSLGLLVADTGVAGDPCGLREGAGDKRHRTGGLKAIAKHTAKAGPFGYHEKTVGK